MILYAVDVTAVVRFSNFSLVAGGSGSGFIDAEIQKGYRRFARSDG